MSEILLGILSGVVGAIVGMLTARKLWFDGDREKTMTQLERERADDAEADRIIALLKEYHKTALDKAKLEYEIVLYREVAKAKDEIRTEMQTKFDAVFEVYACDLAPDCDEHVPRTRALNGF